MLVWRRSALTLLLALHFVAAGWADQCVSPEFNCDFVCDCPECEDELDCGYRGRDFQCDFEHEAQCGWTEQSLNAAEYSWERRQRGPTPASSGPSSDYTTGTASGWFMGVKAVASESPRTAVLVSPQIAETSATCRLRLRYFLWDSASNGLGSSPLWASVEQQDSQEAVVWRPEATSVRGWREDTVFLGRIPGGFRLRLHSQRSQGQRGDVALDHLEFLDCALPLQVPGAECPAGTMECGREGCVDLRKVCDGTDDCGDKTDEQNCEEFRLCDFEDGLCDWDLSSLSPLKWFRTSQTNISSSTEPLVGPGRDHSSNTAAGHFLYVTVPEGGLTQDWAAFQSPRLEPTNSTHPCKMVMYTHQFGPRSGGLTVLLANDKISPVWERGGALGDVWVKAEVELVSSSVFQIVFMAAIRDSEYGGVAVDSIVLSPECRVSPVNDSFVTSFPDPPAEPCTQPHKMCDFNPDCEDGQDEAKCGDFSSAEGSSGWTDTSVGSQSWTLFKNSTSNSTEEYLYVVKSPGQLLTEAQARTPLLGPSGPACTLSFEYALTGNPGHIGELSVRVIDSVRGAEPKMWAFAGKTGRDPDSWRSVDLAVGARKHRFQLVYEAHAIKLCPCAKIKVRKVRFLDCHADYRPHSPTELSCNFEDGLCGWYQDTCDNFDWMQLEGMDHTISVGRSLAVDMWSWSLRGESGRLLSFTQSPHPVPSCLSFYYKIYGPNTGALNVKVLDQNGVELLLWTRSGAHGNVWHEAHCPVPEQFTTFQLIFEAVRSGFDGRIAIDDVSFAKRPCSVPRLCSFEGHRCGYQSYGNVQWLHRSAHSGAGSGPRTDHTLETQRGFYMMVNTGANVLPAGQAADMVSPFRSGSTKTECVSFWYHMGGMNPGSLTLYMKLRSGERMKMFSDSLGQGDMWRHGSGNLRSTLEEWQLEFQVVGAGGKDTFVAVDDIFISSHPCPDRDAVCTLESGMCTWSNTLNTEVDKLDWELTNQEADKHYSTPHSDHTLGTERGHFLFLSSSNRTAAADNAWLLSPHLPPTTGTCLRFWAYRQSSSDCKLKVWSLSEGKVNQLLVITDLQEPWRRYSVDITSTVEYQIVFEGIRGTAGFIGLDDIQYTVGVDCAKGITDTTPGKPDDSGGIAASIIVVLLLIGSLVGALVLYLKKRPGSSAAPPPAAKGGFTNSTYQPDAMQDRVVVPPVQTHPMAAGFNNISISGVSRGTEVA